MAYISREELLAKDFCTSSVKVEGLTGASSSGVISVSMSYGMYLLSDDGMHIYTSKTQSWPITTTQGGATITLDANNTEGLLGHRRISGVNQQPYGAYPPVRPAEYLPTSADYTTYIRLTISLANLVGIPENPASIKITPLIQKIENIYDRNWHASN